MSRRALVYNRSDRHSDFVEADRGTIRTLERELLRSADRVLYVSRALMAEEADLTGDRAVFLDHGVDLRHFRRHGEDDLPPDVCAIPRPRVGFFGALDGQVLDFDLLERLAADLPDASLVLIGDADRPMERFAPYPNVRWLGRRPYEAIPAYGSAFDVAIMPWINSEWIRSANPIKLKEYLALGLPVVSTDFAEVAGYRDRVRVAGSSEDFVRAVRESLAGGGLLPADRLRESVLDYSWDSRAQLLITAAES
jgi:glycosyltransferase involved in cell wall biosynthesis